MIFRALVYLILSVFIWQCSSVPVTSIPKVNAIDFKTTDLEKLAAVVKIPDAIDISKLEVVYFAEVSTEGQVKRHSSILEAWPGDEKARVVMASEQEDGYQLRAFRIADEDIEKLNALRDQANQWKEEYGWARGNAGFSVQNFCYLSNMSDGDFKGNLWVKAEESEDYFLLLRNLDLSPKNAEDRKWIEERACAD